MDAPIELLTAAVRSERFWRSVDRTAEAGCWPWLRAVNGSGYGVHRCGAAGVTYTTMAHRVAWILAHNEAVPADAVIDHTCRHRDCCNPAHLRAVDVSTNVRATSRYRAGNADIVRVGPRTIRPRGRRHMAIWREYLADGRVRQAGKTYATHAEAARGSTAG